MHNDPIQPQPSAARPSAARAVRLGLATAAVLASLGVGAAAGQRYDSTAAGADASQEVFADNFAAFLRRATEPLPAGPGGPGGPRRNGGPAEIPAVPVRADAPATRPAVTYVETHAVAAEVLRPLVDAAQLDDGKLRIVGSDSRILRTSRPYAKVSIAATDVADVTPLGPDTLMVSTRGPA